MHTVFFVCLIFLFVFLLYIGKLAFLANMENNNSTILNYNFKLKPKTTVYFLQNISFPEDV